MVGVDVADDRDSHGGILPIDGQTDNPPRGGTRRDLLRGEKRGGGR
jgi:hypothetical protein